MFQKVLLGIQDIQAAKQEIASLSGRVTQQLTNVVIVVTLPDWVEPQSQLLIPFITD